MDQGDHSGLERALNIINGWSEAFKGDVAAAVVQVQGCGDDHDVVEVRAVAPVTLIPDLVQGFPFWQERERKCPLIPWLLPTDLPFGTQHWGYTERLVSGAAPSFHIDIAAGQALVWVLGGPSPYSGSAADWLR